MFVSTPDISQGESSSGKEGHVGDHAKTSLSSLPQSLAGSTSDILFSYVDFTDEYVLNGEGEWRE